MQETDFIGQNKEKWDEMERMLRDTSKDPDRLTNLFIETTDDLSFSRTYYPNRSVRVYLNSVAQQTFQTIYKNKSKGHGRLVRFWMEEVPDAMWYARKQLLYAFLIFMAGMGLGIFSGIHDPEFASTMLSSEYIQMTEENIASDDPMAVYKQMPAVEMFFYIAWNNIQVTMIVFVQGITFGIGTIFQTFWEGIRIGSFLQFFSSHGLFSDAFFAVMLHGTLELSMIILAACSGLVLARGLVFPGSYSRIQSLMIATRHAFKIMIAVAFLLVVAAFIEGFATRHTEIPDVMRGAVIGLSFALVLGYFVIYPFYRHYRGKIEPEVYDQLAPTRPPNINYSEIKTNGKIFTEIFYFFSKRYRGILLFSLILSGFLFFYYLTISEYAMREYRPEIDWRWFNPIYILWVWGNIESFFRYDWPPLRFGLHALGLATLLTAYASFFIGVKNGKGFSAGQFALQWFNNFLIAIAMLLVIALHPALTFLVVFFTWPMLLFCSAICANENCSITVGISRMFYLAGGNYWKLIGNFFFSFGIQWLCLMVLFAPLRWVVDRLVSMNVDDGSELALNPYDVVHFAVTFLAITILLSFSVFSSHLYYFSALEMREAGFLRKLIGQIGFKRRAYGLEKEI
ncbi:MAG: stage II sporulation protein M [Flavobacteriales bacterium]|nr:stage II sporulation protein M [Flavobacteriales bacterium]